MSIKKKKRLYAYGRKIYCLSSKGERTNGVDNDVTILFNCNLTITLRRDISCHLSLTLSFFTSNLALYNVYYINICSHSCSLKKKYTKVNIRVDGIIMKVCRMILSLIEKCICLC